MSFSDFVRLPPELMARVASSTETPRDLLALIKSSRHVYQVFQGHQTTILAAVIRNAMPDDNIYTAIAACKAVRISKLGWAKDPVASIVKAYDDFFEENPRGCAPRNCSLHNPVLLVSLYKLWWIVDYFQYHFEHDAFETAAEKLPSLRGKRPRVVTRNENTRLQRAFLRFEVYRRVTPLHLQLSAYESVPGEAYVQTLSFLKCFPPWEREEIISVYEFLITYIEEVVSESEDHLVREISCAAHDMAARFAALQQTFEIMSPYELWMQLELEGVDIFEFRNFSRRRFHFVVSRGLRFIRWLSFLPSNDQLQAIIGIGCSSCTPTLFDVLVQENSELTSYDAKEDWPVEQQIGCLRHANQGWLWAETRDLTIGVEPLLKRYDLRRMGYVFWDVARLCEDWKLPNIPPSILNLCSRCRYDDGELLPKEATFQERVQGIMIPKQIFHQKSDKIDASSRLQVIGAWDKRLDHVYKMSRPFSEAEAKRFGIEY